MWQTITQYVEQQLQSNQFFSGGLVLMIAGGVLAYLRHWPSRAWNWIESRFMIEVDILDRDSALTGSISGWPSINTPRTARGHCL